MRFFRSILFSALVLVVPAGLVAQQQGAIDPAQLPPEAQEMITELQQIQATLQPIHQEAMQHPEIQAAQQELGAEIQSAMVEVDPETPERMARLQALMQEGQAAQQEEDRAKLNEIAAEAQVIEQQLQAAEAAAIQKPEIAPKVEAFQEDLLEKMVEINPETETLIERARELDARLSAAMGQGG